MHKRVRQFSHISLGILREDTIRGDRRETLRVQGFDPLQRMGASPGIQKPPPV